MPKNQLGFLYNTSDSANAQGEGASNRRHQQYYTHGATPVHNRAPNVFRNQLQFSTTAQSSANDFYPDEEHAVVIDKHTTSFVIADSAFSNSEGTSVTSSVDLVLGGDYGYEPAPSDMTASTENQENEFTAYQDALPTRDVAETTRRTRRATGERRQMSTKRMTMRTSTENESREKIKSKVARQRQAARSSMAGGTSRGTGISLREKHVSVLEHDEGSHAIRRGKARKSHHPVVRVEAKRRVRKGWNNDNKTTGFFDPDPPKLFGRRRVPVPSRKAQTKLEHYRHKMNDLERTRTQHEMEAEVAEAMDKKKSSRRSSRNTHRRPHGTLTEAETRDLSEQIADRSVHIIKQKVSQLENELHQDTLLEREADGYARQIRRQSMSPSKRWARSRAVSSPSRMSPKKTSFKPRVYSGGVTIDPNVTADIFEKPSSPRKGASLSQLTVNHEAAAKLLAQQLIEKEISRQAELDQIFHESGHKQEVQQEQLLAQLRQSVADKRETLTEEVRRPNFYLRQAEEELDRLQGRLFPLLSQAEMCISRLQQHHYVQNIPLLTKFSRLAADKILANEDELADMIVDDILGETVGILQAHEEQARREALVDEHRRQAGAVHAALSKMDSTEEALRAKYGVPRPRPVTSNAGTQVIRMLDDTLPTDDLPHETVRDLYDNSAHHPMSLFASLAEQHLEHGVTDLDVHVSLPPRPAQDDDAASHVSSEEEEVVVHSPVKHASPTKTRDYAPIARSQLNEADIGAIMRNKSHFERYLLETASLASGDTQFAVIDRLCDSIVDEVITSNAAELLSMCDDFAVTLFKSEFGPLDDSVVSEA